MSASAQMVLHCGAKTVSYDELSAVKAPPPEGRWFPLAHVAVLDRVKATLGEAGYAIKKEKLGLSSDKARFFGTLDLEAPLATGVSLSVGVRNSIDKTFPIGFCAGSRVFVCDNLAFTSELLVKRKHTRHGEVRFGNAIAEAVVKLNDFRQIEGERIKRMTFADVGEEKADSLILSAFERGIVPVTTLPRIVKEWRKPSFEDFEPRTYWSLLNAFTTVLTDRAQANPNRFAAMTMRLSSLLEPPIVPAAMDDTLMLPAPSDGQQPEINYAI